MRALFRESLNMGILVLCICVLVVVSLVTVYVEVATYAVTAVIEVVFGIKAASAFFAFCSRISGRDH